MTERIRHLKIKIVNLADEARTIRAEERKLKPRHDGSGYNRAYFDLHDHRVGIVRDAARTNLLAYAFLRGRPYSSVEGPNTRKSVDWKRVKRTVRRFGGDEAAFEEWMPEAAEEREAA